MTLTQEEQRMTALERANQIRSRRAADKKAIYNGELPVEAVILEAPSEWSSATVLDLLTACKRVGEVRARQICRKACIDPVKQLCELTLRQRIALTRVVVEKLS